MRILIVDDESATRFLLAARIESWGYQVAAAANGSDAWDVLKREHFDVVISDWNMPEMNGLELCALIRQGCPEPYRYVILCTGNDRKGDFVTGMEAGADDFIVKPLDPGELRVKLRAAERILQLQANLTAQNGSLRVLNEQLSVAYKTIEHDLQAAAAMQQRLLPARPYRVAGIQLDWLLMPSRFLAGDMLNYFTVGEEHLVFYQLDVSGHGIPAALLSVTLNHLLTAETNSPIYTSNTGSDGCQRQLSPPAELVAELNRKFQGHDDEYFTIVYGLMNTRTGQVQFCQAGHPHPVLQTAGKTVKAVGSGGFPVGMLPEIEYEQHSLTMHEGDRLFLYSDGLTECRNPASEMYTVERLLAVLRKTGNCALPQVMKAVEEDVTAWRDSSEFRDDVSLLVLERTAG